MIQKIRESFETEERDKPSRITQYIRAALAVYLISMGTMQTCECANEYDAGIVSREVAQDIIYALENE